MELKRMMRIDNIDKALKKAQFFAYAGIDRIPPRITIATARYHHAGNIGRYPEFFIHEARNRVACTKIANSKGGQRVNKQKITASHFALICLGQGIHRSALAWCRRSLFPVPDYKHCLAVFGCDAEHAVTKHKATAPVPPIGDSVATPYYVSCPWLPRSAVVNEPKC
jgi:hypothetical protein